MTVSKGSGVSLGNGVGSIGVGGAGVSAITGPVPFSFWPLKSNLFPVIGTGPATFTRTTAGSYVDRGTGLVRYSTGNLIERSEELDNADWSKSNAVISPDQINAPNGTLTADAIQSASNSVEHKRVQIASASIDIGEEMTGSIHAKLGAVDFILVRLFDGGLSNAVGQFIDLTDGSLGSASDSGSPANRMVTTEVLPNGWVRIAVSLTNATTGTGILRVQACNADGVTTYSANTGIDQIYAWGGQVAESRKAGDYEKTVSSVVLPPARFEANGVLIEGASTNLILRSEEFDNAAWSKLNGASITSNFAVAPDGTMTADRLTFTTTPDSRVEQNVSVTMGNMYTYSCYARSDEGDQVRRFGTSSTVGVEFEDVTVTSEWQRFIITILASASAEFPRWSNDSDSTSGNILIWGAQLEELPFATSYIPTVATTVTRAADILSIPASNIPAPTEDYSVSADVCLLGTNAITQTVFRVAGESTRYLRASDTGQGDRLRAFHSSGVNGDVLTANDANKVVMTVDSANITLYQQGISKGSAAKGVVTGTATEIQLGRFGGGNNLFGHIKNFKTYDVALTANQV